MKGMQAGLQNLVHRASAVDARELAQDGLNKELKAQRYMSSGLMGLVRFSFEALGPEDGDTATIYGTVFEFTEYGEVAEGNVPVLIGETIAATLEAFSDAFNACGMTVRPLTAVLSETPDIMFVTSEGTGQDYYKAGVLDFDEFVYDGTGDGLFELVHEGADPNFEGQLTDMSFTVGDDPSVKQVLMFPFDVHNYNVTFQRGSDFIYPTGVEITISRSVVIIGNGVGGQLQAGDIVLLTAFGA